MGKKAQSIAVEQAVVNAAMAYRLEFDVPVALQAQADLNPEGSATKYAPGGSRLFNAVVAEAVLGQKAATTIAKVIHNVFVWAARTTPEGVHPADYMQQAWDVMKEHAKGTLLATRPDLFEKKAPTDYDLRKYVSSQFGNAGTIYLGAAKQGILPGVVIKHTVKNKKGEAVDKVRVADDVNGVRAIANMARESKAVLTQAREQAPKGLTYENVKVAPAKTKDSDADSTLPEPIANALVTVANLAKLKKTKAQQDKVVKALNALIAQLKK